MSRLSPSEITAFLLALGVLLGSARVLGELCRRIGQPAVLGEILAGILLGPTVLGRIAPEAAAALFPSQGGGAVALNGFTNLAVVLFLLVAGLEVHLSSIMRQGRAALSVSVAGMILPFAIGLGAAWALPEFLGQTGHDRVAFSLFIATAMAISALPVIARTLMDLDLYRTDLGMVVMAAAIVQDLAGWIIFAIILGMIGHGGNGMPVGATITLTIGFAVFMATIGRWLIGRAVPWVHAHTSWPGGILGFVLALTLFGAAFTEWIGIHAIFGAFMVGLAVGDCPHLQERTRRVIEQFVSFVVAPIFFASIGLRIDFIAHSDLALDAFIIVIACAGKILGAGLGALGSGMPARESWAVGFAMNARGAMEIILGLLALQYGLIDERLFVALVIMALATSLMSGPAIQRILRRPRPRRLAEALSAKAFIPRLEATFHADAIAELSRALAPALGRDAAAIADAVNQREEMMTTWIGEGLAVPHARLKGLAAPVAAVGLSPEGVRFGDEAKANIVVLVLTPEDDDGAQLELLSDVAHIFRHEDTRRLALKAGGHVEFLGAMRTAH
jgi:Kef-type K+ transport system membrane component KefB/mannitol/fructose-specific phosphotransferase system IIA component (Ntr-type)